MTLERIEELSNACAIGLSEWNEMKSDGWVPWGAIVELANCYQTFVYHEGMDKCIALSLTKDLRKWEGTIATPTVETTQDLQTPLPF